MKKLLSVILVITMSCTTFARTDYKKLISPDDWNAIDVDAVDHKELIEAFNALRDTYSFVYDEYIRLFSESYNQDNDNSGAPDPVDAVWDQKYFVDEFNQPTDNAYLVGSFVGSFSNAVTTNSDLKVEFLVSADKASIFLYEYGDQIVKNIYSDSIDYSAMILDDQGEKHSVSFFMATGSDRITALPSKEYSYGSFKYRTDPDYEDLITLMKNNKSLSFSIRNTKFATDHYVFVIENMGDFAKQYDELLQ